MLQNEETALRPVLQQLEGAQKSQKMHQAAYNAIQVGFKIRSLRNGTAKLVRGRGPVPRFEMLNVAKENQRGHKSQQYMTPLDDILSVLPEAIRTALRTDCIAYKGLMYYSVRRNDGRTDSNVVRPLMTYTTPGGGPVFAWGKNGVCLEMKRSRTTRAVKKKAAAAAVDKPAPEYICESGNSAFGSPPSTGGQTSRALRAAARHGDDMLVVRDHDGVMDLMVSRQIDEELPPAASPGLSVGSRGGVADGVLFGDLVDDEWPSSSSTMLTRVEWAPNLFEFSPWTSGTSVGQHGMAYDCC